MDLAKEIREFEAKGVFIHLQHEHYTNGSNCNWSIEFTKLPKYRGFDEKNNQTGWYGDNHEFGDTVDCYAAAFRLARFLLEGDNLKWYFFNVKETVTPEGHAEWMKYSEVQEQVNKIVFQSEQ